MPGFPTSSTFTFSKFIAPVLRALAGIPPEKSKYVKANLPVRLNSEKGKTDTNFSGGIQGGISNGMDIYFNVAFKGKATVTVDTSKSIRKKLSETSYIMTGSYVFCLKSRESKDYLSWYTFLVDLSSDSPIRHHHSSRVPFEFDLSQTEEKH